MGAGIYKVGVPILVTYQAPNVESGLVPVMEVYNEGHAYDVAKSGDMTELMNNDEPPVGQGRYYKSFTPDAEGEWTVLIWCGTSGNEFGQVVKSYSVCGHDVDSIGDAVSGIQSDLDDATNGLAAIKNAVGGVSTQVGEVQDDVSDAVDTISGILNDETNGLAAIKTEAGLAATPAEVAAALSIYDAPTKAELDAAQSAINGAISTSEGVIAGALEDETNGLAAIKTAVNSISASVSSPAMVG
jgi:hypothetical protein